MKKVMFAAIAVMMLASCKKDWTCECSDYGETTSYVINNRTKRDAKKQCEGKVSVGFVQVGGNNCGLK
jgi:hypothetical protein